MKAVKHTPGPWFTHREGFSSVYIEARIGGGILQEVASCGPTNEGSDQQEANARLIAAAPEMLEALKWYEHQAKEMGKAAIHSDSKRVLKLMQEIAVDYGKLAGAAIAKATGRADSGDGPQKDNP